jgi:GT2 family glycosyltransferase
MPKNNEPKDLSIIILNYNGQFWLKKLLPNLKKKYLDKSKYKVETIVVDNSSTDDSVKILRKNFKWVKVIESGRNGGFAYGNNVAIKDNKARFVMLLNSDTDFLNHEESNLDHTIDYMLDHKNVAVITPRVELSDGSLDQACHRGEPTLWASFTYIFGLEKIFPKSKLFGKYHQGYKNLKEIHEIDACSGAAMIVRTSAIKKVGLLDDSFFMYAEDLDWCKRFRDANYRVVFYPGVKIVHHKYKSGIKSSNKKTATIIGRHFYKTMLQYYDKHYSHKYPKFFRSIVKYFVLIKTDGR